MNKQKKNSNISEFDNGSLLKKEDGQRIELRSDEVQELMTRPPRAILRCGITVILILVIIFFCLSFFIVYPEKMTTMAKIFPPMDIECLDAPSDGRLLWVADGMSIDVKEGDTLAILAHHSTDTTLIISYVDGHAYKADALERNSDIKAGQRLFYITRSNNNNQKHKVHGVIYLARDSSSMLRLGQTIYVSCKGVSYPFEITEFGRIANNDGKYPIGITYTDSLNLFNNIEPERSVVTIKMSNQTIFKKFFSKHLNILNKFKIN